MGAGEYPDSAGYTKRHRHRYRKEAAFSPAGSRIWEIGTRPWLYSLLPCVWLFFYNFRLARVHHTPEDEQ